MAVKIPKIIEQIDGEMELSTIAAHLLLCEYMRGQGTFVPSPLSVYDHDNSQWILNRLGSHNAYDKPAGTIMLTHKEPTQIETTTKALYHRAQKVCYDLEQELSRNQTKLVEAKMGKSTAERQAHSEHANVQWAEKVAEFEAEVERLEEAILEAQIAVEDAKGKIVIAQSKNYFFPKDFEGCKFPLCQ